MGAQETSRGAVIETGRWDDLDRLADAAARFAADLYYFVARRVVMDLGEAGEKAVRQGLREFGLARGQAILAEVEAACEEVNLANFLKHYNLPMGRAWRGERTITPEASQDVVTFCPFADQWQRRGGADIGQMYCEEVDPAIREGYSPHLHFTATQFLLRDGAPCRQRDEMKGGE